MIYWTIHKKRNFISQLQANNGVKPIFRTFGASQFTSFWKHCSESWRNTWKKQQQNIHNNNAVLNNIKKEEIDSNHLRIVTSHKLSNDQTEASTIDVELFEIFFSSVIVTTQIGALQSDRNENDATKIAVAQYDLNDDLAFSTTATTTTTYIQLSKRNGISR